MMHFGNGDKPNETTYRHLRELEQFIPEQNVGFDGRLCVENLITADFTEVPQRTANITVRTHAS